MGIVTLTMERRTPHPNAKDLFDHLLSGEISEPEFLRQADKLSDRELRLLRRFLMKQSIRQKRKGDNIV